MLKVYKGGKGSPPSNKRPVIARVRSFIRLLCAMVFLAMGCSILLVVLLKWVDPPFSSFMVQERVRGAFSAGGQQKIRHRWVPLTRVSPHIALAVLAAEDQSFTTHRGFDFKAIRKAIRQNRTGKRLLGASTISQQVAKNLFLWQERSLIRKGLEAYFTLVIELCWDKRRILEVYLNTAEWGDGIYGVETAALTYFKKSARELSRDQAALLAAILPNPSIYSARSPSSYILHRKNWILRQMRQLGTKPLDALKLGRPSSEKPAKGYAAK